MRSYFVCEPKRHSLLQVLTVIAKCLGNGRVLRSEKSAQLPLLASLSTLLFEQDCSFLHYFLEPSGADSLQLQPSASEEDLGEVQESSGDRRLNLDRKALFEGKLTSGATARELRAIHEAARGRSV